LSGFFKETELIGGVEREVYFKKVADGIMKVSKSKIKKEGIRLETQGNSGEFKSKGSWQNLSC
jgi:hypothetical protein